jgi:hypothetical protein
MKLGSITPTTRDGIPRFRTRPEFEEKYCTGCQEYWPCDPEFYRKMHGYWAARCRACEAEGVRRSRAKSLSRCAANAAACLVLMAGAGALPARAGHCDDIAAMAYAMQNAKLDGYGKDIVVRVTKGAYDPTMARYAVPLAHLVYDVNDDDSMSAGKVARVAKASCLSTEANALQEKAP